jgi:hypothetical protein
MRKSIHSLSCGFVVLAVVLLSISPSDNLFGLEGKTVSAKSSNIQFKSNATGRLESLRYLNNLGFPGANMFSMAAVGEATTKSAASLLGGQLAIGSYAAGFGSGLANATETAPDGRFLPKAQSTSPRRGCDNCSRGDQEGNRSVEAERILATGRNDPFQWRNRSDYRGFSHSA